MTGSNVSFTRSCSTEPTVSRVFRDPQKYWRPEKEKGSSPSKELDENSVQWEMRFHFSMSENRAAWYPRRPDPHPVAAVRELPEWRGNQMHRHLGAARAVP